MKVMPSSVCWGYPPMGRPPSPVKVSLGQVNVLRPPPGLAPNSWGSSASTSADVESPTRGAPGSPESPSDYSDSWQTVGPQASIGGSDSDCQVKPTGSFGGDGLDSDTGETRTTLHIRNLPCSFKRRDLLGLINGWGLEGQYDFVYLPLDFRTRRSIGYAFVNFQNSAAAQVCMDAMHGFTQWSGRSRKACYVEWSQTQGYEANVRVIQKSKVMKLCADFKPVVFENGNMVPFPS